MSFRSHIWRMNSKTLFLNLALIYQVSYVMVYFTMPQSFNQKKVSYATRRKSERAREREREKQFGHATVTFSRTYWNRYTFSYLKQLRLIVSLERESAKPTTIRLKNDMQETLVPRSVVNSSLAGNIVLYRQ